jgi:hypothetical protein
LVLPTWEEVRSREYHPWRADLVVDTGAQTIEQGVSNIRKLLSMA